MSTICPHCGARQVSAQPLTERQRAVLVFIDEFTRTKGFAPNFEEIAIEFGFRSLATVHEHLGSLSRKGWITREFNASRAIQVIHPPPAAG